MFRVRSTEVGSRCDNAVQALASGGLLASTWCLANAYYGSLPSSWWMSQCRPYFAPSITTVCISSIHPPPSLSPPLSRSVHRPRTPCPPRFHDTYSRESHGRLKVRQKYIRPGGSRIIPPTRAPPSGLLPRDRALEFWPTNRSLARRHLRQQQKR